MKQKKGFEDWLKVQLYRSVKWNEKTIQEYQGILDGLEYCYQWFEKIKDEIEGKPVTEELKKRAKDDGIDMTTEKIGPYVWVARNGQHIMTLNCAESFKFDNLTDIYGKVLKSCNKSKEYHEQNIINFNNIENDPNVKLLKRIGKLVAQLDGSTMHRIGGTQLWTLYEKWYHYNSKD